MYQTCTNTINLINTVVYNRITVESTQGSTQMYNVDGNIWPQLDVCSYM